MPFQKKSHGPTQAIPRLAGAESWRQWNKTWVDRSKVERQDERLSIKLAIRIQAAEEEQQRHQVEVGGNNRQAARGGT